MFNTVIHDTCEATPYITAYFPLDLETMHLQLEATKEEIQDTTSDYLFNISTLNTNIPDTADEIMDYIA